MSYQSMHEIKAIFCDMDGTLLATDKANFLAYKKAVFAYAGKNIVPAHGRFTSTDLRLQLPNLSVQEYEEISALKTDYVSNFLHETQVNKGLMHWLMQQKKNCSLHLVTKSNTQRALVSLQYHKLLGLFDTVVCKEDISELKQQGKFVGALSLLGLAGCEVLGIENEAKEVQQANKTMAFLTPNLAAW